MYYKAKKIIYNYIYVVLLIVVASGCSSSHRSENKDPKNTSKGNRPNILLILSDDMGFSDLHSYGSIHIKTPNLDKLAHSGLRYTDFHNVPHCAPSRAALLTGLYSHQTGLGWMPGRNFHLPGYTDELNKHCVTIAQVLGQAGYATYMTGKWHLVHNRNLKAQEANGSYYDWPLQRGFDKFYGIIKGAANYYDPGTLTRENGFISPFDDSLYQPKHYYFTNAITDNTIKFLRQRPKNKPFFMYVAYTTAHWPMQAPEKAIDKYKGSFSEGWDKLRRQKYKRMKKMGIIAKNQPLSPLDTKPWAQEKDKKAMERRMETYAAMITIMDRGIGKIVQELKDEGVFDNTVIFFLEDNGGNAEGTGYGRGPQGKTRPVAKDTADLKPLSPDQIEYSNNPPMTRNGKIVMQGKKVKAGPANTYLSYLKPWANVSNTPFRQYKNFTYGGGTSTPLIVHWPDGINNKYEGEFRRQLSHEIDIMPTIMQLAGSIYPKTYQGYRIHSMAGESLVPTFLNKSLGKRTIFWAHEGQRAERMGKWKIVSGAVMNGGYGHWKSYTPLPWQLYNMDNDRAEMTDVSAMHPKLVREMVKKWEKWAHKVHVYPMPWKKKKSPIRGNYMSTPWQYPNF
jgi:arylsulfatase